MQEDFPTDSPPPLPDSSRGRGVWLAALAAFVALLMVGLGVWVALRSSAPRVEDPVVVVPPAVVEAPPQVAEVSVPEAEANAVTLLAGLSSKLGELIGTPGLLRKIVAAVQLASEGESYLHLFSALRPGQSFEVIEKKRQLFIDPSSYARYDQLTELIANVDATRAAAAYQTLSPALEQLYGEVGRPGAKFSEALAKALSPVIHTQISDEPVEVVPKGLVYQFKDPNREGMDPTSKLLVRVGPVNARKLQAAARAFLAAAKL